MEVRSNRVMTEGDMDKMFKEIGKSKENLAEDIVEKRKQESQESKKKFPFTRHKEFDADADLDAMEEEVNKKLELARKGIPVTLENGIEETPTLDMIVSFDPESKAEEVKEKASPAGLTELPLVMDISDPIKVPVPAPEEPTAAPTPETDPPETLNPPVFSDLSSIEFPTAHPEMTLNETPELKDILLKLDAKDKAVAEQRKKEPVTLRDILVDFDVDTKAEASVPVDDSAVQHEQTAKAIDMILDLDKEVRAEDNGIDFTIVSVSPIKPAETAKPEKEEPEQTEKVQTVKAISKPTEAPSITAPAEKEAFRRVTEKPARAILCVVPCATKGSYNYAYALTTAAGKQFFGADRVTTSKNMKDQWHFAILKSVDRMLDRIEQISDECVCVFINNRDAAAFMNRTAAAISQSDVSDGNMSFVGKYKKLIEKKTIYFGNAIEVKMSSFEEMAVMTANQNVD